VPRLWLISFRTADHRCNGMVAFLGTLALSNLPNMLHVSAPVLSDW
jgi:hypothetical protein